MLPMISHVHFEQTPERLKIVLPIKRRWFLMTLYTLLVLVWVVMLAGGVVFTIQEAVSGERYAFVFTVILLILLFILYRLGRRAVWQPWQGLMATREVLFINKEQFIIRRPLSLLGTTDFYALEHIGRFFFLDEHHCPAFSYGQFRTEFGHGLERSAAESLITFLNDRYIPEEDDDDDE